MHRSYTRFYVVMMSLCFTLCFSMTAFAGEKVPRRVASASDASRPGRASPSDLISDGRDGPEERDDVTGPLSEPETVTVLSDEAVTYAVSPDEAEAGIVSLDEPDDEKPEIVIRKTGAGAPLRDDAVFCLYRSHEDAIADEDAIIFSVDASENAYYMCDSSGCPEYDYTDRDIYAGATGTAHIRNLEPGFYYLKEVAAPKGYQKLPFPYQISLEEDGSVYWREDIAGTTLVGAADGLLTIENRAVQVMPTTGWSDDMEYRPEAGNLPDEQRQERAILQYRKALASCSDREISDQRAAAERYNEMLKSAGPYEALLCPEKIPGYEDALDVTGTGIMGTITIDRIGVDLPIYHGTDYEALAKGAGHLEGSSLPTGGKGNHSVISAHSGFPGARLFTDLNRLNVGDIFTIHVPGDDISYAVDSIKTVLPTEIDELLPDEEEDYCTLMTCIPYGINTHRLLVRGRRIYMDDKGSADKKEYADNKEYTDIEEFTDKRGFTHDRDDMDISNINKNEEEKKDA